MLTVNDEHEEAADRDHGTGSAPYSKPGSKLWESISSIMTVAVSRETSIVDDDSKFQCRNRTVQARWDMGAVGTARQTTA